MPSFILQHAHAKTVSETGFANTWRYAKQACTAVDLDPCGDRAL